MLRKMLLPKQYLQALNQLDLDVLAAQGIRGLIFDLDNTLVPRDVPAFSPATLQWLEQVREKGFQICIVSNNGMKRLQDVVGDLSIPFIHKALKPFKKSFYRAMESMGTNKQETAVIGDQIFTDMVGGNRMGLYTILVTPLAGKEYWATEMINRRLERLVLRLLR